jgi:5-methylthioadenosine/S-adenosylhomocysteine deaminase
MNSARKHADTLIEARWIVPVEPAHRVLEHHALAVINGKIDALLPIAEAREAYTATETVELPGHVLLPGLINLHCHSPMTLMRGLADDLHLMEWLKEHIWPAEMKHVSPGMVYDGSRLACAEMLRGGITCFNDMYFFPRDTARAAIDSGMRCAVGLIVIEFPSPYAADAQDYLSKGLALRDEMKGEPLLHFCFAPHAPYTVNDDNLRQVATYAGELDMPVQIHLHETLAEIEQSLQSHQARPLQRLADAGLLGPGLIAVHAVHLEQAEIELLARHGCHVAHCPSSNLKLGSGIAPVAALLDAGVNVGLGTDGAASNNRLDMFEEMRLAALLAKGASGDAATLPAWRALEMATINGARALALDNQLGSLKPGKLADLTAVNLSALELTPCYEPLSHLVYAAGREHVSDVWVNGRRVLDSGTLTGIDCNELVARANFWRDRIHTS